MALGVQLDAHGRVRLDASGRVILANAGDPCCCGGGGSGDPCECEYRTVTACPGTGTEYNCEALEYTVDIDASGSTLSTIADGFWFIANETTAGLFTGSAGPEFVPDPPPEDGVLIDFSWNLNANVSVRCVDGNVERRTSGTFSYSLNYYGYQSGAWDNRLYSDSVTWADEIAGSGGFGDKADLTRTFPAVGRLTSYLGSLASIVEPLRGLFPPITAPVTACSESHPSGSLLFAYDRVPMYDISNQVIGLDFLPQSYNEVSGATTGANDCDGSEQAAEFNWTLRGLEPYDDPSLGLILRPFDVGGATQTYNWSTQITVLAGCDAGRGALGGL